MLNWIKQQLRIFPVWMGLVILGLFLVAELVTLNKPGSLADRVFQRMDTIVYDWRFGAFTPDRPQGPPIVIVDIDEESLKQEGRWPWSRARVADLVDALKKQGAAVIGFDVVFSEPEINPATRLLDTGRLSPSASAELSQLVEAMDADARFAGAMRERTVIGYLLHNEGTHSGKLPPPFFPLDGKEGDRLTVNRMKDFTGMLPVFASAASGAGFISTLPDGDGIIRRSPLVLRYENGLYSSLALEMARQYLKAPFIQMQTVNSGGNLRLESLTLGKSRVFTDESGLALIPYKGKSFSYPYLSATKVLRSPEAISSLKGAIVLVGTSALGLSDLRTTPLETGFPGVEVHANLIDVILQSTDAANYSYYRPDWEPGLTFTLLLISGLAFVLVLPRLEPGYMLVVSAGWLAVLTLGNLVFWKHFHYDTPLSILMLSTIVIAIFNISYGFLQANIQKREMKTLFGQYVPPAHVDQILMNSQMAGMEGESRHMTVLFSDIRSFTTISEGLKANRLKQLLNDFFTPITGVIFAHNGTIDKYVGDMVMAFWNAPLPDENHAEHAIEAAMAMQRTADELKPVFAARNLPEINIGIGVNTGFMNVGDMGSQYRRTYTVIGDAVNLGSRLEGLTKFYGVKLLVGEGTYDLAPMFLYRLVDKIIVKGKREPVCVYEPVCRVEDASDSRRSRIESYNRALDHYYSREWDDAEKILRELHQGDPDRILYKMYLERIPQLRHATLPDDWMGVFEHHSK
ncbi:MAG: adenylate/guanylate cyclase domain-containing protein [Fluviicoccus sp.]|uniref:CHASE2 domain-containing protein n=1 Tax=Fluviicoccus sp. TaxID=2003552 RepID=UPI00271E3E4C|nr:adenylate/guanylate cyclase domain-containing protein [Fluviicoccus sp.]MDO8329516.1 adenylate/guanylate cyclase domain-containing protein [Fluviicoccus sp.]